LAFLFFQQLIVRIQLVLAMEAAFLGNVFVKPVGKEKTVEREINKFINVCRAARIMGITISRRVLVFAIAIGLGMIVRKLFAVWTVDQMEFVSHRDAVVIPAGLEPCANS
jgi:hypothetical protein